MLFLLLMLITFFASGWLNVRFETFNTVKNILVVM